MSELALVVLWLVLALVSYRLIEADWLRRWDLERGDRRAFVVMSLFGPASLLAALIVYFGGKPKSGKSREVVKRKRT